MKAVKKFQVRQSPSYFWQASVKRRQNRGKTQNRVEHIAKLQNMKMRSADARTKAKSVKICGKIVRNKLKQKKEVIKKVKVSTVQKKNSSYWQASVKKRQNRGKTRCKNAKNENVFCRCPAKKLIKINMYQNFLINK